MPIYLVAPRRKVIHLQKHVAEELAVGLVEHKLALGTHLSARALQHLGDSLLVVRECRLDRLPLHARHAVKQHIAHAHIVFIFIGISSRRAGSRLCLGRRVGDFDHLHFLRSTGPPLKSGDAHLSSYLARQGLAIAGRAGRAYLFTAEASRLLNELSLAIMLSVQALPLYSCKKPKMHICFLSSLLLDSNGNIVMGIVSRLS